MATEIVRELVNGEWVTTVGTGGGGAAPDLAAVLTAGGDAGAASITNLASLVVGGMSLQDLFGAPALIPSSNADGVVVCGAAGTPFSRAVFNVWDNVDDTNAPFTVFAGGEIAVQQVTGSTNAKAALFVQGRVTSDDRLVLFQHASTASFSISKTTGIALNLGPIATLANTAPADGSLGAGEAAIWFDATNGSAKLMVKAKQADGTVKTGSLNVQT